MKRVKDLGIIIAAGGSSLRFGSNKLFELLNGIPLFIHSLLTCSEICDTENIRLVAPINDIEMFKSLISEYSDIKIEVIPGGKTRMHSVQNGLRTLHDEIVVVAIHDAARPLTPAKLFKQCYKSTLQHGNAIAGRIVVDTVKQTDKSGFVERTIDRDSLALIETPQMFLKKELISSYNKIMDKGIFVTDDAAVMEEAGVKVYIEKHNFFNIKITFPEDIPIANAFIDKNNNIDI